MQLASEYNETKYGNRHLRKPRVLNILEKRILQTDGRENLQYKKTADSVSLSLFMERSVLSTLCLRRWDTIYENEDVN